MRRLVRIWWRIRLGLLSRADLEMIHSALLERTQFYRSRINATPTNAAGVKAREYLLGRLEHAKAIIDHIERLS